ACRAVHSLEVEDTSRPDETERSFEGSYGSLCNREEAASGNHRSARRRAVSVSGAQARSDGDELKGAGSTFVAPLVTAWQQNYQAAKGVKISYNPIGS